MDQWWTWLALAAVGLVAGVINTLAGGGTLLTVPALVYFGLPATVANGTNRIGVLLQNVFATRGFRREGFDALAESLPIVLPAVIGSIAGATVAARMSSELFEKVFGVAMVALLVPILRPPTAKRDPMPATGRSAAANAAIFGAIGFYGGSIQAGVGIFVVAALARSGLDLVRANAVKVILVGALTAVALPVFLLHGQIDWPLALALASGFSLGGSVGARVAARGGERVIKPVLVASVLAMAGRMLGLY
ncbi:MAG: sulfite exporter TauE/SafE family protein [Myxococcota bacterium]